MKKIILLLGIVIIVILSTIYYIYVNNLATLNNAKKENEGFEAYYDKELSGAELVTFINKGSNYNVENNISKDGTGKYIDNGINSINIDIKFIDNDSILNFEKIYDKGTDTFIKYYREIIFKCTQIKYHESTGIIRYMLFEQITI